MKPKLPLKEQRPIIGGQAGVHLVNDHIAAALALELECMILSLWCQFACTL